MCPLCLGTATLLVSGSTSAGGVALALLRKPFRRWRARATRPPEVKAGNR